ncbi:putative conserved protein YggE, contains kinase-interacting SIMPL domain [Mariprofundus ferrinatatus]|uniref:Putative conserved protein YggE, contains kinase-interacting SIMPL domain n=1 Tax=Mariprofundus ferrinatatus TaxID=1921087 RepID=A0A2K8L4C1_9PROT|nr:SIMPL domain-containing protein [Mariprofundus ferrinatatus]ATX81089.1 putative conserved protein YggE, contains kinase-interacting SIMPL domain [Mariprofundus ferrinatatus]
MRLVLLLSLILLTPVTVQAENGQPAGTRITISATAEAELPNDEVVILYRVEREGKDVNDIRRQVNRITTAIQKRLQLEKGVKVETTSRRMQPVWQYPKNKPRIRSSWHLTQSEQVTSSNLDALPEWLDAIETEGAQLSNLQFRISRSATRKAQDALRMQAIETFRNKAATVTRSLAAKSFRIIRLNSSSQAPQPVVYRSEMAMMAKAADAAPPSLSSGEGMIQITVNGEIEVPFTDFPAK